MNIIAKLLSTALLLPLTANAMPTTVIKFAKGSTCGIFAGDLSKGRKFTLNLGANQELIIHANNIDNAQVDSVIDAKGTFLGEQGKYDSYSYKIKNKGKHIIRMHSDKKPTEVEFCAY